MKKQIIYSIDLGLVWCFVTGNISIVNFLFGATISYVLLIPLRILYDNRMDHSLEVLILKIPSLIRYFMKLAIEIMKASIAVAKIIIQPKINIKPGLISVPIRVKTYLGITTLANTITLTRGTLTVDVSDDRSTLYVHCIDIDDVEKIRDSIKYDFEDFVMEAFE
jgi:multicomponent Na+:H+ antiporter subunit E